MPSGRPGDQYLLAGKALNSNLIIILEIWQKQPFDTIAMIEEPLGYVVFILPN